MIDLRTLRPARSGDGPSKSLAKTNRLVVAEEGWPTCFDRQRNHCHLAWRMASDHLDAPVLRVCNEDVPLPYAANLEKLALVDAARIVEAARKVCYK